MPQHPIYVLPCPSGQGELLLTPCPGSKNADLETSLRDLKNAGASAVLTLMTQEEMHINNVGTLASHCQTQGFAWFHLPMDDECAPAQPFLDAWAQHREEIHRRLNNDETIALHCKGGSGRTGIVAAQILMERGAGKDKTIVDIKALRPNAFSHAVQIDYIQQFQV